MKAQYMLAIIPPDEVRVRLEQIRQEVSDKYNVKEALRNPIHITLIPPFHFEETEIATLQERLNTIKAKPIVIQLRGFGGFPKNKVVFINVIPTLLLSELHHQLVRLFAQTMPGISIAKLPAKGYKPHITMAYRDLNEYDYKRAQNEYFTQEYKDEWIAASFVLWKRLNKEWHTVYECKLG